MQARRSVLPFLSMDVSLDTTADFVARGSRARLLSRSAACFGLLAFGLWSFGAFGQAAPDGLAHGVAYAVLLAIGTTMAGFYGLLWLVRSFQPREELRIGPQGFFWSRRAERPIPWAEITQARVRRIGFTRFLILDLRDPNAFPPRGVDRLLHRVDRLALRDADIAIDATHLDRTQDDVMQALMAFCPTGVTAETRG